MGLRCNIFMGHSSASYILFYVNQQPQCFNPPAPTAHYLLYMKQETTLLSQLQAGKHTNGGDTYTNPLACVSGCMPVHTQR